VASKLSVLLAELKRRKVARVAVVYALVGLGVIEGASMILPTLQLEPAYDYVVILVLFGFPVALVLAWALEITPQGIQKTADVTPEQLAAQTPDRWRASSWVFAGVGVAAVLAAGYFVFFSGEAEPVLPDDYVAVFPFENLTGEEGLDDLGSYAAHWITDGLSRVSEIRTVATNTVAGAVEAGGGASSTLAVAMDLQVGIAVTGVYALRGDSLEFRAEISRVPGGDLLESAEASGTIDDPRDVINGLRQRIMGAIAASLDETVDIGPSSPPTYEAFQAYKRGLEFYMAGDWMGAIPHFEEASRLDSTSLLAPTMLGMAYSNTGQRAKVDSLLTWAMERRSELSPHDRLVLEWGIALASGNREAAFQIRQSMFRMDPTTYAYEFGFDAIHAGRPREALDALSQYDPDTPSHRGWYRFWYAVAEANHMLGRYREELAAARQGRERFPDDLFMRWYEIRALLALGRLGEIEPLLEQVEGMEPNARGVTPVTPGRVFLNLVGPVSREGHSEEAHAMAERSLGWYLARDPDGFHLGRALALILANRPAEALPLFGQLLEQSPEEVEYHIYYGIALALTGDRDGAEAEVRWCAELDRPNLLGIDEYCRAQILSYLGRKEEATSLLRRALQEGWSFWGLQADPHFKLLWGFEPFEQLVAPRG
jgi:tetratricopeptide (TPR) repeat protein